MAAVKLMFLFSLGFSCTYARVLDVSHQRLELNLKDDKSDAIELLDDLERTLNQFKLIFTIQVGETTQLLNNAREAILADSKETLGESIKPMLTAIRELQDQAADAGVDITDCIGSSIDDINALPTKYVSNVSVCLDGKLGEAKEHFNQIASEIDSTFDIIPELRNQIDVCGNKSSVHQVECFSNVTATITDQMSSLSTQIINDALQVRMYGYSAIPQMAMCGAGTIDNLATEGFAIVANVTTCASKKTNKASSPFTYSS